MLRPCLTLIAGPNGSGKSSVTEVLMEMGIKFPNYHNADELAARGHTTQEAQNRVQIARAKALDSRESFTYETVLSHSSHIAAMRAARDKGYYVRLIFITTRDPSINISRVADRVAKGGHDVPTDKVISRYHRVMTQSLPRAVLSADESMIWDNSAAGHNATPVAHVMGQYVRAFDTPGLSWPNACLFGTLRASNYYFE